MLQKRSFVKRTRRGNVVKVVKEHYLRDDIGCGSAFCSHEEPGCKANEANEPSLSGEMIIVVDTNVVLHQIDVLEVPIMKTIVVCQTVLQEAQHRSLNAYHRLRTLISQKGREFYVFANEHHRSTFVKKEVNESPNDRNDRAIRTVCSWYKEHLGSAGVRVLLLTNDGENKQKALNEGLESLTLEEYVESLGEEERVRLRDVVSTKQSTPADMKDQKGVEVYPEHLKSSMCVAGVESGKFVKGVLRSSRYHCFEGHVDIGGDGQSVKIGNRIHMNRGIDGDIVAVQILESSEETTTENTSSSSPSSSSPSKNAKVVGIIKRNWKLYGGSIRIPSDGRSFAASRSTLLTFVPSNKCIPNIKIRTHQAEFLCGQRIVVAIDEWDRSSRFPFGHYVRSLGEVNDIDTERELLLMEHDVSADPFSDEVLACLPQRLPWTVDGSGEFDPHTRRDLRHINAFSVDPPGCTDIDDALSITAMPEKSQNSRQKFEVGVHIADVTHFVRPHTAMDDEAAKRATTVYLVDRRIDMLPELLGTNLCSLMPNQDRFAFSVMWEMDKQCNVYDVWFGKTVIRSRGGLAYAEAQAKLDNPTEGDQIGHDFADLTDIARVLKNRRMQAGALTLASSELTFALDRETHDVIDCEPHGHMEANSVIEEFMLFANATVAKKIYDCFKQYAVLRRHPPPPPERFESLQDSISKFGFKLDLTDSKSLADSIDRCNMDEFPFFNTMVRMLTTRCMQQAKYFCTGLHTVQEFAHYGLAMPFYTHFTSPIRRYSDVVVHRFLAAAVGLESIDTALLSRDNVKKLTDNMNYRHYMAKLASDSSSQFFMLYYFRSRPQTCEAVVMSIRKNGIVAILPKYRFETLIYLDADHGYNDDSFVFDEETNSIVRQSGSERYRIFDRFVVSISVDESSTKTLSLNVKILPDVDVESVSTAGAGGQGDTEDAEIAIGSIVSEIENEIRERKSMKLG